MVVKGRLWLDPVADLKHRLARPAHPRARRRSRSLSAVRGLTHCVRSWWRDHGLATHPGMVGKRIALALIAQRRAAPKLAGMFVLRELLAGELRASDLPAFAHLFRAR